MVSPLFSKPALGFKRERELRPQAPLQRGPAPPPASLPEEQVFDTISAVLDKARTIEDAIHAAVSTLTVPVGEAYPEVRAAVLRQDPASGGLYVTFALYLRALRSKAAPQQIAIDDLRKVIRAFEPGDSLRLREAFIQRRTGKDDFLSRFLGSQASVLYSLQLMQAGLQALETQRQTAVKYPPGTEAGPSVLSVVQSIAFMARYTDQAVDLIEAVFADLGGGPEVKQAAEAARSARFDDRPLAQAVLESKAPGDLDLIVSYVRSFLARTEKLGYEPWLLLPDVLRIRDRLEHDLRERPRYERVAMDRDLARVLSSRARAYSRSLDAVGTALGERDLPLSTLCSVEWLTRVPLRALELLKSMYQMLVQIKSVDLIGMITEGIEVDDGNWFANAGLGILHDVLEVLSRAGKQLVCWFQRDPDVWALLEQCPPVAEMADMAVTAIEELEKWVFALLDSAIDTLRSEEGVIVLKAKFVLELKKIRMALAKIGYAVQSASSLGHAVEELRESNIDVEVFEDAAQAIEVELKDKPKELRDIARKRFDSDFLRQSPELLTDPGRALPVPPFPGQCGLGSGRPIGDRFAERTDASFESLERRLTGLAERFGRATNLDEGESPT